MVATAHPLATRAALDMLDRGGAPIDAAIAAQMVLGLVEPQSSGIGGGSVVMAWDASTRKLASFDGLATAPAHVTASLRTDVDGSLLDAAASQRGGRSVGVPGTLPVLKRVHERLGKLPWSALFEPAIAAAESGFPMAPYLHQVLSRRNAAANHPEMVPLFFGADGSVLPVGATLRNPEYARTLRRIAAAGPDGLFENGGAQAIVDATRRVFRPSFMTVDDLRGYRAVEREPLCAPFIVYTVCTMAPPSFGGIQVLQILQMVEMRSRGRFDFDDPAFAHLYAEAGMLARADRVRYADDPDHAYVPARELVSSSYLRERAAAIDLAGTLRNPQAKPAATREPDEAPPGEMTSQIAIVDKAGNALSITTTINLDMGSRLMVGGFVLNDAMVVFTEDRRAGAGSANRMAPRKRPATSMAPVIAFDREGRPVVVGGSAGGSMIPDYVASALIEMLGNGRSPAEALARGHITTAVPGRIRLEAGTPAARLAPELRAMGHRVEEGPLLSGLAFLKHQADGWVGAADPRRDGTANGE
jgi:gamma-glutamyltranspeptidase/glutathione hydrolase